MLKILAPRESASITTSHISQTPSPQPGEMADLTQQRDAGQHGLVWAIAVENLVENEVKGDELVDVTHEMVLGNEFLEGDHLNLKLLGWGSLSMVQSID